MRVLSGGIVWARDDSCTNAAGWERKSLQWIAPSERDTDSQTLENRLWAAADQLRANSGLTSTQYSQPVLGLIFLRFAEVRFDMPPTESM